MENNFGFIFWVHLVLIITAYSSPFLFNWKLIFIGVVFLYLQQLIYHGCILTQIQFGKDPYMTFYYQYLVLLGINVDKKKLKFFMAWIMPVLVFLFALLWQIFLKMNPLLL
ncbi:MAG: hypothetical protein ACOYT4_00620 [Nanoarchaeota archaeon]